MLVFLHKLLGQRDVVRFGWGLNSIVVESEIESGAFVRPNDD
jgi:hypothetical protein